MRSPREWVKLWNCGKTRILMILISSLNAVNWNNTIVFVHPVNLIELKYVFKFVISLTQIPGIGILYSSQISERVEYIRVVENISSSPAYMQFLQHNSTIITNTSIWWTIAVAAFHEVNWKLCMNNHSVSNNGKPFIQFIHHTH